MAEIRSIADPMEINMCIWSIYSSNFDRFFGGSTLSKVGNLSNILESLIESVQLCTM